MQKVILHRSISGTEIKVWKHPASNGDYWLVDGPCQLPFYCCVPFSLSRRRRPRQCTNVKAKEKLEVNGDVKTNVNSTQLLRYETQGLGAEAWAPRLRRQGLGAKAQAKLKPLKRGTKANLHTKAKAGAEAIPGTEQWLYFSYSYVNLNYLWY